MHDNIYVIRNNPFAFRGSGNAEGSYADLHELLIQRIQKRLQMRRIIPRADDVKICYGRKPPNIQDNDIPRLFFCQGISCDFRQFFRFDVAFSFLR